MSSSHVMFLMLVLVVNKLRFTVLTVQVKTNKRIKTYSVGDQGYNRWLLL